jgi:hypothetical protein
MGYVIFWFLLLATALLFLATFTASAARSEKRVVKQFLPRLVFILILLLFLAASFLTGVIYYVYKISPLWPFYFFLTLTIAFILVGYWAMQRGLSKSRPGPPAASWSRGALAGFFGIVLCLCLITFYQLAQDARIETTDIRTSAVGLALRVWPAPLPTDLNGAEFYHQASLALMDDDFYYYPGFRPKPKKVPKGLKVRSYFLSADFDPNSADIQKTLEDNRITMELIDKGASCPGIYHKLDTESLPQRRFYNYYVLKKLVMLKQLEAISKAHNGDMKGAMADLAVIERVTDQILSVPLIRSVISSETINRFGYNALEYILAHYEGNTAEALPLITTGRTPAMPCLARALEMETSIWLEALYQIERHPEDEMGGFWMVSGLWKIFYLHDELNTLLFVRDMQAKAASQPYPEAVRTYLETERRLADEPQGMIARIYTVSPVNYSERVEPLEARRRLAALAIAAFNYKQDNGRYPGSLEDLVPKYIDAVPIDPFDLKPLKMKALDDGLDLYSVGPNPEYAYSRLVKGPIHFYLGAKAYQEYRAKPYQEE